MPERFRSLAPYAGYGTLILTIACLLVSLGAKTASAALTVSEIKARYDQMAVKLDKNTQALNDLNGQLTLLNFRLSRIEEASQRHVNSR